MHKFGICGPSGCYSSEFLEINRSRSVLAKSDHFGPNWTWYGKVTFWSKSHCVVSRGSKKSILGSKFSILSGWRILVNFQYASQTLQTRARSEHFDPPKLGSRSGRSTFTAFHFLPTGGGGALFGPRFLPGPEKHPF